MDDAESLEAFDGLGGEHGGAVVGEQRARQSAFLEGLGQAVHERLGGFVEIPLQVAAEAGAVVENAEQLRGLPLSRGGEHGTRALVEVQVPETVHVRHLVRTRLTRDEGLAARWLAMATFARAQEALAFHEAAQRRVAGNGSKTRILASEREQVVVMELEAPSGVIAMLAGDRFGERVAEAGVGAGVSVDLARKRSERICGRASDVPPSLDGLEREADGLAVGRVAPGARGELLDAAFELARVSGRSEQRADDLKAQTGPSHTRAGRVIGIGHANRARSDGLRRYGDDPTRARENKGSAIFCASAGARDRSCKAPQQTRSARRARRRERRQPDE